MFSIHKKLPPQRVDVNGAHEGMRAHEDTKALCCMNERRRERASVTCVQSGAACVSVVLHSPGVLPSALGQTRPGPAAEQLPHPGRKHKLMFTHKPTHIGKHTHPQDARLRYTL